MPHTHEVTAQMRECIQHCLDCHAQCLETAAHCLTMGGEHAQPLHQRLLHDCTQSCLTSADFMLRTSHYHARYCGICAEICQACADDCTRLANGDAMMLRCADACRRCAESCRQMASAA